ncbi:COX15/CtaA family protein [Kiloniella laminariae]|uniref:Heme A synthase n=1 Tax=Kiloniella laminariae TaxID=454162 RepID=A0ABT4LM92_9PROT|nr:COX15/CtaA family protein [Kiloniella laminariae]MCZ4282223.1 COX15/CtaA family protein [Kiloniella laminariae]
MKNDTRQQDRPIAIWLLVCCAMILIMAVIGAITRLTESGLSIMEWNPIGGALPPLSETEWQRLFTIYQQIPEYQQENAGMSLEEFKGIFWWEFIHRLWGRAIGVVFLVPFLWFWLRGQIRRALVPHLLCMFLLGGLQGALGWYMVASGFADRTDVSQYRLTAHLLAAFAIYAYLFWVALGLLFPQPGHKAAEASTRLYRPLALLPWLIVTTIASGGLVAGLNAGMIYNTFPLMEGQIIPPAYNDITPWYINLFENVAAVQFNHRLLAVTTVAMTLGIWLYAWRLPRSRPLNKALHLLVLAALVQLSLGISTLLLVVPITLGALHQAGGLLFLTASLYSLFLARRDKNPSLI